MKDKNVLIKTMFVDRELELELLEIINLDHCILWPSQNYISF